MWLIAEGKSWRVILENTYLNKIIKQQPMAEIILPGTYIKVYDEGLISAGSVSTGNIGIVGIADKGPIGEVKALSSFSEARSVFGEVGEWDSKSKDNLSLVRSLEQIFNNGGRTVYAVRVATNTATSASLDLKKGTAKFLSLEAKTTGTHGNLISAGITEVDGEKKLLLADDKNAEKYTITAINELVELVNEKSSLVKAAFVKEVDPDKIDAANLSGGNNGEKINSTHYKNGLELLENDIINIVLMAGQDSTSADLLGGHLNKSSENKRERITIVGVAPDSEFNHSVNDDRIILVTPGIKARTINPQTRKETTVDLPASYAAAAIAGMLASLPVQASPTNKVLAISGLSKLYNTGQLEKLIQTRVLAVEKREGYRVVKGITTATNSAWHQITTRRIVDYAIYGVRSGCNPYIGKLNNERVRGALKATLDSFLTRMVNDEALISYELEVTATRAEQIEGVVMVSMTLRPTFSIDFIKVNMYLS